MDCQALLAGQLDCHPERIELERLPRELLGPGHERGSVESVSPATNLDE